MTFNIILSQGFNSGPICPIHTFWGFNLLWTKCLFETLGKFQMGCELAN